MESERCSVEHDYSGHTSAQAECLAGGGQGRRQLVRTELLRATRGVAPDRMQRAQSVLDALILFNLTSATFERAATLDPAK
jgi:hypothetical protein